MASKTELNLPGQELSSDLRELFQAAQADLGARDVPNIETSGVRRIARPMVLALLDSSTLAVTMVLAVRIWAQPVRLQSLELYLGLWPLLGVFLVTYGGLGLYPGFGLGAVETLRRCSIGSTGVFGLVAASSFLFKVASPYSRVTLGLCWIGALLLVPLVRFTALAWLKGRPWWPEPAVVVGRGGLAEHALAALKSARTLGYQPRWLVEPEEEKTAEDEVVSRVDPSGRLERFADSGVRVAFVAIEGSEWEQWVEYLQDHFRHVIAFGGPERIPIEGIRVRNLGGVLGLEFRNELLRRRNRAVKRAADVFFSALGLVVTSPLVMIAAIAVRLQSPGSAFFHQKREGLNGRTIRVWKLRTMYPDAERRLEEYLRDVPEARQEWASRFKLRNDPRILPFLGSFLRRFSIDELPQFWSILRGDMSLVGPRPLPRYHLEVFPESFRQLRRRVRPGATGLWQVTSRGAGGHEAHLVNDTFYIRNWSVWLDVYIMGRTVLSVLAGRGA